MPLFDLKSTIRINCAKRQAEFLELEVKALGYEITVRSETGVEITGTLKDCMRLNLHLRSAFRVLFMVADFEATNPDDLYRSLVDIPWEEYIPNNGYFSVSSFVDNPSIKDSRFANLRVKDAVVDRIQNKTGKRPDSGPANDKTVLFLYWRHSEAAIFIDTSGETIARHGYRANPHRAPLQESLATAIILATGWNGGSAFVNPMCGSGTLAIEAAMIAINKPPGLLSSNFGFMHLVDFPGNHWNELREKAAGALRNPPDGCRIIATDRDWSAIEAARKNARQAGVEKWIDFKVCDYSDTAIPDTDKGIVIMNPEYGQRISDEADIEKLYAEIGDFLKQKCKGYTGYIFTGNLEAAKRIGLKPSQRIPLYNGTIDCRLLKFELYEGTRTMKSEPLRS